MTQPTGYQIANAVRNNKISTEFAANEAKKYNVVAEFNAEMVKVKAERMEAGRIAVAEYEAGPKSYADQHDESYIRTMRAMNM